jgi:hypothetical protein
VLDTTGTAPGQGLCLERHDLVASKLAAGRPKDHEFAEALVAVGLINLATLKLRIDGLDLPVAVLARLRTWVERATADESG